MRECRSLFQNFATTNAGACDEISPRVSHLAASCRRLSSLSLLWLTINPSQGKYEFCTPTQRANYILDVWSVHNTIRSPRLPPSNDHLPPPLVPLPTVPSQMLKVHVRQERARVLRVSGLHAVLQSFGECARMFRWGVGWCR